MKKLLSSLIVTLAFLPSVASAGPILAGTVNGVLFCALDNVIAGVCAGGGTLLPDLDPTLGSLQLGSTNLGGVTVNGSSHTQVIGPPQNSLNSQSLQVINNTGGTINAQVAVGGINYVGPISSIQSSGSGTWQNALGSTIGMSWYADVANSQGGESFSDTPGVPLATFMTVAGAGTDAFAFDTLTAFAANTPYSMTMAFNMNLVAGGQLISRGQNMIATTAVPDATSTMMLLGLGTGLLAAFRARK